MNTDIDQAASDKIVDFCNYQMKMNVMGIGNECTHFVYAALFEVNAEDGVVKAHKLVKQNNPPYVWGRKLSNNEVKGGDVAQFQSHKQELFIFSQNTWSEKSNTRGPLHTGIAEMGLLWGSFDIFESHIHQPGVVRMRIRTNTVYYESYGIVVTEDDLKANSGLISYLKARAANVNQLLDDVNWGALRTKFGVDIKAADAIKKTIKAKKPPMHDGKAVAIFFEVKVSGDLRFYRPLVSDRRKAMNKDEKAKEKEALIKAMIKGGRAGHKEKDDEYGGDLKKERIKLHAFEWQYPNP